MYFLLALLIGAISSLMISINGSLASVYGTFIGTMIVHIVGSLFAYILCHKKDVRSFWKYKPKWIYLGGAVGIFTTLFQSASFGKISTTSIVALNLAGQGITSLLMDTFGLLGMPKRALKKSSVVSICFSVIGIAVMLQSTQAKELSAILMSIGSGVSIVISRTINARLAKEIHPLPASLINHLVGLPLTVIIAIISVSQSGLPALDESALVPWIYCGGMFGVCSVMLLNIAVPKLPALQLTTLSFAGQILMGIAVDFVFGTFVVDAHFIGGMIIIVGVFCSVLTEAFFGENVTVHRVNK